MALNFTSEWFSVRAWVDCMRAVWLPGRLWLRSGRRQPLRKTLPPVPFRPQLTPMEERLSAGVDVSMGGIAAAAMGAAAGFFTQALVRELVAGPTLTGSEEISLTAHSARGDIASAAPPPDDAKDARIAETMAESIQVSSASPESREPVTAHRTALDQYFASLANPQASSNDDSLTTPLDQAAAKNPQNGGGHKIDDGSGNGGGGHGGSTAPAVDAEGSADPLRGPTNSSASSNYLSNSALATAMAGNGTGSATAMALAGASAAASAGPGGTTSGTALSLASAGTPISSPPAASASSSSTPTNPVLFSSLPASENSPTQFQAEDNGINAVLQPQQASFVLNAGTANSATVQMNFVGANTTSQPVGLATANSSSTTNPAELHGFVNTYSDVQYQNLYNGINLDFYGNTNGQLEYTWTVAAGANPNQIQLGFQGADHLSLNSQGNLQISADGQTLQQNAPVAYQMIDGVRQSVDAHFVLEANQQVGVAVGKYDPSAPLVIDPVLTAVNGALYGSPTSMSAGNTPDSIATLKLDNGQQLVLTANYYGNDVTVQKSNGDGTYTSLGTLPTGNGPNGFAVGDFGNGHQDFAIANFLDNTVTVYLGDGTGNFTTGPTLATGSGPSNEMAIGDFTGNGILDLATANKNDGTVSVFKGNGDGTFQSAVNYSVGSGIDAVTAGDFNGGGSLDLAVANFNNSTVSVLTNNGDGTFTVGSPISVGANPFYLVSGQFTKDGRTDIATANFFGNSVSELLNQGNGTFSRTDVAAGAYPDSLAVGDVTGTGQQDLVVGDYGAGISVLLATSGGTFLPAQPFAAGNGPNGVAVATNLTGSGKLDVVVADQNSGSASVLGNTSLQGIEGHAFSGVIGGFTDSNASPGTLTATVNWGDGSALDSNTTITATGSGSYTVSGSHTYDLEGAYTIQVYVRDSGGNEATISNIVYVGEAALTATAPTLFGTPTSLSAGNTPDSIATLKLDNGQELVLVANYYSNTVTVHKSNGDGTFTNLGTLATGQGPNGFAVGDFGNGHQDFAIANFLDSTVTVYLGDGTGNFTAGPTLSTGSGPANEMAVGDFNGDGKLDLATANQNDGTVSVFMGNGDGTFQNAVNYSVGTGIDAITAGDFRGNGLIDLAVANYNTGSVTVLQNQGNGTFTVGSPISVGSNPWYITSGDFLGNGKDDLATANYGSANVSVLLSNGDDTFQSAVNYAVGSNPTGIVAASVRGSSTLDLVTSNFGSNNASVLLGNGDGTFQAAQNYSAGSGPNGIAVGDLTGTGKLDVVVADQNSSSASVLFNQTPQAITGQTVSGVLASFTDADPNAQPGLYTATVNWGDGSPLDKNAIITANGSGGFDVSGSHSYNAGGNYTIQVTIQDGGSVLLTTTNTVNVNGPSTGTGTLTVNAFNNNTSATITFNNAQGNQETLDTLLTQMNLTYNDPGNSITYNGFCIDLNDTVTVGKTYAVNAQANLASQPGGSRIAYLTQKYGSQDLTNAPVTAAALQTALWSLLTVPNARTLQSNGDGTYSPDGQSGLFKINFNGNSQTGNIVTLANSFLSQSLGATAQDDFFASVPGQNAGQSMTVPSSLVDNLVGTKAQASYYNPLGGDSQSKVGNNQYQLATNLTQSPDNGCSCSCNQGSASNQPSVPSGVYYNSSQVNAKQVIQVTMPTEVGDPMPTSIVAQLTFNGVTQAAQTFNVPANLAPGTPLTLALQASNAINQTGRYPWQVQLTANYGNGLGSVSRTLKGSALVVDPDQAGTGWSFGMIDQLIPVAADANGPAGVIRVYGTGGASFYQANGNGTFQSPSGDNGSLVQNGNGSYTYTTPGGVTFNFNSAGQETSQISTCGCIQYTFTYDGSGRLATMTGTDGAFSTFNYDGSGNLTSISVAQSNGGPVMRTYSFTHDASGNLTGMTNPDGSVYNFTYDANGHLTSESLGNETNTWTYQDGELATIQEGSATPASLIPANMQGINGIVGGSPVSVYTDPNGNITTTVLDDQGRPLQQTDALGGVNTNIYNAQGFLTSTTDPNGNTTNYELDSDGYVLQTTYPDGSTDHYTYDSLHDILSYTDQNGHTTTYTYDSSGHMLSQTDPLGNTTTYTWSHDLMATMTDPNGGVTQYFYDSARRLIETIDPMGFNTFTSYDSNGFVASTTDAKGFTTSYVNDPMGRVLSQTDPLGNTTSYTYDANSNLTSETDANLHTTQYAYNDRGLLATTTDALGNTTTNAYDANGNLTSVTEANLHTTQYVYDALNRQTKTIDPLNNITQTVYDANGNVIATTDANGNTTRYVYDSLNRQIYTIDPLNNLSKTGYDPAGNTIYQTDANGNTTTFAYDAANQQTATTDPLGNTSTAAYDGDGNVIATTDANGNTTTYTYDKDDRQITVTDPLGFVTSTGYDPNGNVTSVQDANGNVTTYGYDKDNRQTSMTDPLGFTTTTAYDGVDNVIATTDANGNTTTYAYDKDNRQTSMTDPLGFITNMSYDAVGNVISTTDANGNTTTYAYDADNRETIATDPLGNKTTTAYDANGNVTAVTDPNGNTTKYSYDAENRQTAVTNALGNSTATTFDGVGNVTSVTDPLGNKTTYAYDEDNREVSMTDSFGHTETVTYDAVGNLISTTDRDGRITDNTYDADNRLVKTIWIASDGITVTDTKTFTYDGNGNLLTAKDNAGTYTMTYDRDNRLATQTDPFGLTLTYGYDGNGNTISEKDSLGGTTTSTYDKDNRLTSRQFTDGTTQLRIDFTYDGNGNVLTETRYADLAGTQKVGFTQSIYDADNRVTSIQHQDGSGNVLAMYTYTYDAGSRLTSQTVNGVTTNYGYDAINELTADGSKTYTYDANLNRTGPGIVIGPNNELLSDGTWNYSYDAEGNLIQKVSIATGETWTYSYDNLNQLTSVTDKAADGTLLSQSSYTLDVFGNRVAQSITISSGAPQVTQFAYDNAQGSVPNIWADLDSNGSLTTRRIFGDGLDQPLVRINGGGVTWYLTDHLGSIMALMSNQGQLIDQVTYDAFGNILSESDPLGGDRYKYTGTQFDTLTSLALNGEREYGASTGRWTTQDPEGLAPGPNLYSYVGNNPTNATDPFGLAPLLNENSTTPYGKIQIELNPLNPEDNGQFPPKYYPDRILDQLAGAAGLHASITFTPNKDCKCDKVRFVQIARLTATLPDGKQIGIVPPGTPASANGWFIDNGNDPSPYYGDVEGSFRQGKYGQEGNSSTPAILLDRPHIKKPNIGKASFKYEFATFAVCVKGKLEGQVLACVSWTWNIDRAGKVTLGEFKKGNLDCSKDNQKDLEGAAKAWNDTQGKDKLPSIKFPQSK